MSRISASFILLITIVAVIFPTAQASLIIREPSDNEQFLRGETIAIDVDFSFGDKIASNANVRAVTPTGVVPLKETLTGYEGSITIPLSHPMGNITLKVIGTQGGIEEEDSVTIRVRPANLKIQVISPELTVEKTKGDVEVIVLYPNGQIARGLKVNVTSTVSQNLIEREGRYMGVYDEKKDFSMRVEASDKYGNYGSAVISVKVQTKGLLDIVKENIYFLLPIIIIVPIASLVLLSMYQKTLVEKLAKRKQDLEQKKKELQIGYFQGKMAKKQFDILAKSQEIEEEQLKQKSEESKRKRLILKGWLRRLLGR